MSSGEFLRRWRAVPRDRIRLLRDLGYAAPEVASRILLETVRRHETGIGGRALAALLEPLAASPDPDRALGNLAALLAAATDPHAVARGILAVADGARALAVLLGSSQSSASFLIRNPDAAVECVKPIPDGFREAERRGLLDRVVPADDDAAMSVLRRHRKRITARILADDLVGRSSLEVVTRRVSDLAEDLIEAGLAAAQGVVPVDPGFAVIALGKLGGRELNYASDVDLVFVHENPDPSSPGRRAAATRHAERLCRLLSRSTGEGRALLVDMRLRPEGAHGPLVRSFDSTLEYYRSTGRTWERQALIKARPVAGDLALGGRLVDALQEFVWERALFASGIREIQDLKGHIESRARARGREMEEVKEGRGGIRDIEFTVQFLQLLNGHEAPRVRCAGTLDALTRLQEARVLSSGEHRRLEKTYRFLRTVEHRLQTMHETPARRLPTEPGDLRRLARRVDPAADPGDDPAADFIARYRRLTDATNAILERLVHDRFRDRDEGAAAVVDAVLDATDDDRATVVVANLGFRDPGGAVRALRNLAREDSPHSKRIRQFFASVAPALLRRVVATVDPDATLLGFERLVAALGAKSLLYRMLDENEDVLTILVDLCGGSPYLTHLVTANPEMFDPVLESLVVARRGGLLPFEDLPTVESLPGGEDLPRALHALRDLEMVRAGIRDLQGRGNVRNVMEDLTRLAQEVIGLALAVLSGPHHDLRGEPRRADGSPGRFAILGLGRLGAGELIYGSDLDLIFVHDADGTTSTGESSASVLTELAQKLISVLGGHSAFGRLYQVDARLRPGGKSAPLVSSSAAFGKHLARGLETWERLALTRVRTVAGDVSLGEETVRRIHDALYGGPPPDRLAEEVLEMRRRLEDTASGLDLKRGAGGLVDIEFLTGWLQLRHGHAHPTVRAPSLMEALAALTAAGKLSAVHHEKLRSAYQMLRKVESRLRIAYNRPLDRVPESPEDRDILARRLGYRGGRQTPGETLIEELGYFTGLTRVLFEETVRGTTDDE